MDLFLHILLYIGWFLLFILCLCVLCILLILFFPVSYKGKLQYEYGKGKDTVAYIKGGWFFNFISFSLKYNANPAFSIKILWFRLNKKSKDDSLPDFENETTEENANDDISTPKVTLNSISVNLENDVSQDNSLSKKTDDDNLSSAKNNGKKIEDRNNIFSKIKNYLNVIKSETFKRAYNKNKKKIFKLIKGVLPKKLFLEGSVGFDDPSITGSLLAISGMLYPLINRHIKITGNFEKEEIIISGNMKGRITIFALIFTGLQIYLNKDIKKVIKMLGEA